MMIRSNPSNLPISGDSARSHEAFDFVALADEFGGTTTLKMKARTVVYRQGGPANALFYVQEGRVRINVVSIRGKEAIMAILGKDTIFGETCLLGEPARVATATCLVDSELVRIERAHAIRALRGNAEFAEFVLARALRRVGRLRGQLISQLFDSSERRLARILLMLANYGQEDWKEATIDNLDQEDLAQMVGTTRGRISHFMNKFRRLGYIDYNGTIAINQSLSKVVQSEALP